MLEETSDDAAHADGLTHTGHPGAKGARPPHPNVDRHPDRRRSVERIDGLLVYHCVALDTDAGWPPCDVVVDLAIDAFDKPGPHGMRGDDQTLVLGIAGISGENVEQVRNIFANVRLGRQQAEVFVQASRLGVVVPGANMTVATELTTFVTNDHRQFAVGLQPNEAVHDVHSSLLELSRPLDVVLLVEAGFDLNDRQDLLALFGSTDEGIHDG